MSYILVGFRSNLAEGLKPLQSWFEWSKSQFQDIDFSNIYRTQGTALSQGWLSELWAVARLSTEMSHFQVDKVQTHPKGLVNLEVKILAWSDQVLMNPSAPIPHPDLHRERVFLQCCAELEPNLVHPILGKPLVELVNLDTRPLGADFYTQGDRIFVHR